jgi:hypothetical protein
MFRNKCFQIGVTAAAVLLTILTVPSCKSAKNPDEAKENAEQAICDCPEEATKAQTESRIFLTDALLPREWSGTEKEAAAKSVRDYRQGFFTGTGGSWGSCQFKVSDELLAKILADKEARAKRKEFDYRTDTPQEDFRNWFDTQAMGLFENKQRILETCQLAWWRAGKHPGEYFRSWERTAQSPRWSVVVKVCPAEKGMRWVFFRCTAD